MAPAPSCYYGIFGFDMSNMVLGTDHFATPRKWMLFWRVEAEAQMIIVCGRNHIFSESKTNKQMNRQGTSKLWSTGSHNGEYLLGDRRATLVWGTKRPNLCEGLALRKMGNPVQNHRLKIQQNVCSQYWPVEDHVIFSTIFCRARIHVLNLSCTFASQIHTYFNTFLWSFFLFWSLIYLLIWGILANLASWAFSTSPYPQTHTSCACYCRIILRLLMECLF